MTSLNNNLFKRIFNYLVMFLNGCRYRGILPQLRYAIATEINKSRFKALNNGLNSNQIAISKDVILNIHSDAYYAFRYFTEFDPEMVLEMQSFIKGIDNKKCFLDIGAHYGIFSLVFANRPNAVSFAVEPSSSAYKLLCYHQQINPDHSIIPFQLAMGTSNGKLQMSYGDSDHLIAIPAEKLAKDTLIDIDVVTIDTFVEHQNIVPDVIKIDTEGFELNILKGAVNLLNKHSPMIFLEVHPTDLNNLGQSVDDLIILLSKNGYKIYNQDFKIIKNIGNYLSHNVRRVICIK